MSSLELQFTDSRILEPRILDVLASDCSASTACASSVSSIYSCRTPQAVSSNYIQDCLSILHAKIFLQGNCLIHAWNFLTDWSRAIQLDDLIFRCNHNESTDYYSLDQSVQNTTGLQHPRKRKTCKRRIVRRPWLLCCRCLHCETDIYVCQRSQYPASWDLQLFKTFYAIL